MAAYYTAGIAFAIVELRRIDGGAELDAAVHSVEPWSALVLVPAALVVLAGFASFARTTWRATASERLAGRAALAAAPQVYAGRIPARARRMSPVKLAAYELPMGVLGFPGVGWLFAGFPLQASVLLCAGPAFAWAVLPIAFTPYGQGAAPRGRLEDRARVPPHLGAHLRRFAVSRAPAATAAGARANAAKAESAALRAIARASASRRARCSSCSSRSPSCPRSRASATTACATPCSRRCRRPSRASSSSRRAAR